MDDYQSSFSGEEIDDILAKAKSGDFTVQSDYAQNDSTQLDYIKNRPFYTIDGFSYEWDGTTPDETKKVSGDDSRYFYYKISDNIMSVSDLIGAKTTINSQKNTITESSIETYENGSFCYKFYNYELVLVCVKAGSFATLLGTVELTPGLWFMHPGFIVSLLEKEAEIKQIDNEYIAKATALDDDNADLPVTAGLVKTEIEKKADLVDGKIPVEQLPDGKEVEVVTCNLDIATLTISNMSHTFQQILEAIEENKNVIGRAEVPGASVFCTLAFVQSNQIIAFNLLTYMDIGNGTTLYYFRILVNQNDDTSVTPLIISTLS